MPLCVPYALLTVCPGKGRSSVSKRWSVVGVKCPHSGIKQGGGLFYLSQKKKNFVNGRVGILIPGYYNYYLLSTQRVVELC